MENVIITVRISQNIFCLLYTSGKNIERVFNFKYPYEYISRFNELIERKSSVTKFYNKS